MEEIAMSKDYRGYDYHSGSNVVITLNDQDLLECVGLSYSVMDSSTPIYGYSSRLFDAVAPGQKIIQGSFVVNFNYPNYVYDTIKEGIKNPIFTAAANAKAEAQQAAKTKSVAQPTNSSPKHVMKSQLELSKNKWWGPETSTLSASSAIKDPTLLSNVSIQVLFDGTKRGAMDNTRPVAGIEIYGVYLIGHGMTIQADDNVLLEEYNFFGRTLRQLKGNRFNMGA